MVPAVGARRYTRRPDRTFQRRATLCRRAHDLQLPSPFGLLQRLDPSSFGGNPRFQVADSAVNGLELDPPAALQVPLVVALASPGELFTAGRTWLRRVVRLAVGPFREGQKIAEN